MAPKEDPRGPDSLKSIKPEHTSVRELHSPLMREKHEPRDGNEPIPLWLTFVFGALLFWGGAYTMYFAGGFRGDVLSYRHQPSQGAEGKQGPVDPLVIGEKVFKSICVSCHQADGQGEPGHYPPLAGSPWVQGEPARIKRILLHGLEGKIEVLGATFDGQMPVFGHRLSDARVAGVLSWIRQAWGNDAPPIPEESVAATRKATKDRTTPWTVPELEAVTTPDWTPPPAPPPPEPTPAGGKGGG